jgi:hypothetical protein
VQCGRNIRYAIAMDLGQKKAKKIVTNDDASLFLIWIYVKNNFY